MLLGDPRNGAAYRRLCKELLSGPGGDLCGLCGHRGAATVDHIVPRNEWWLRFHTWQGFNHPANLQPAHGTKGRVNNRCAECVLAGKSGMCNQSRGAKTIGPGRRSRAW